MFVIVIVIIIEAQQQTQLTSCWHPQVKFSDKTSYAYFQCLVDMDLLHEH